MGIGMRGSHAGRDRRALEALQLFVPKLARVATVEAFGQDTKRKTVSSPSTVPVFLRRP